MVGKTTLITGSAGLIGSYLAEAEVADGAEVVASYLLPTIPLNEIEGRLPLRELDVTDREAVFAIVAELRPTVVFHLAAQSLPTVSWVDPWTTMQVNVIGTINIFEAIKALRAKDSSYDPIVIVACSSAEYGTSLTPDRVPITEDAPLMPMHPYGVSKVAQDLLTLQYWINDHVRGIRARIFNCTGARKRNDVVSDFGSRIVKVLRDGGRLAVGNLETRRAIIDVRDMVSALRLLAVRGAAGEVYNICAEDVFSIRQILDMYLEIAGRPVDWAVDPALLRPSDEPVIVGSTEKLRRDTGWRPTIPLHQTLRDVFDFETRQLG